MIADFHFPAEKVKAAYTLTDRTNRHQQAQSNVPHMGDRRQMLPMTQNFTRRPTLNISRALAEKQVRDTSRTPRLNSSSFLKSRREGIGNYETYRDNFRQAPIIERNAPDNNQSFAQTRALDIEKNGLKIQLGDKAIQDLFWTRVPDPSDLEWLAEKLRLVALGLDYALPFNRPQRQITLKQNLGDVSQAQIGFSNNMLTTLTQQIAQGRTKSADDMLTLQMNFSALLRAFADGLANAFFSLNNKQDQILMQNIQQVGGQLAPGMIGLTPEQSPKIVFRFWNHSKFIGGLTGADLKPLPGSASPIELLAYAVSRIAYPTDKGFRMEGTGGRNDGTIVISQVYKPGVANRLQKDRYFMDMKDGIWKTESRVREIIAAEGLTEPVDTNFNAITPQDIRDYDAQQRAALLSGAYGVISSGVRQLTADEQKKEDDAKAALLAAQAGIAPTGGAPQAPLTPAQQMAKDAADKLLQKAQLLQEAKDAESDAYDLDQQAQQAEAAAVQLAQRATASQDAQEIQEAQDAQQIAIGLRQQADAAQQEAVRLDALAKAA